MSLQFYFGSSGAGKSGQLHRDIIQWAQKEPQTNFLILVPDQFTMQTQMDLVKTHPNHGILNIDVLSFGRLSHRIWEEVGGQRKPVLDDTGKSLILRKVAADYKEELPYIGSNLKKQGYIHEIKSSISEFMQYGIDREVLAGLLEDTRGRQVLNAKLQDLSTLYQAFYAYINGQFITTEETLDILREKLKDSRIIKDSVVALDGFTGFTPVQYRLLQELMIHAKQMIVAVTIDGSSNPFRQESEQELFYLSKKTVSDLCKLADEAGIARSKDVYVGAECNFRFQNNPEMAHLEQHIFRYPVKAYEAEAEHIRLFETTDIAEEVRQVCLEIRRLVTGQGYCYRDIAVITGDLNTYARYVEREAKRYEIPVYLDRTRGIRLNPMIEYIRSALKILIDNFSYESVFHYMRSGFADFTPEETDLLENYVLSLGIRGKRRWQSVFTRKPKHVAEDEQLGYLDTLNQLRQRLVEQLMPLMEKAGTAGERVQALYQFITQADIQQKLAGYEAYFKQSKEAVKEREYAQIYRLVMELLEQIYGLLAQEAMTMEEFADILDAGFLEIEVGSIPQNIDRVVVGDMERTRLKQVKVLFFLGVNDGNIPKAGGTGGIISDLEREYLQGFDIELAPTPRQKIYIQRLYLYINMTKPSDCLYLSYARMDAEGKTIRPAYLIDTMQKLFPRMIIQRPQVRPELEQMMAAADALDLFIRKLRQYADGYSDEQEEQELFSLYQVISRRLTEAEQIAQLVDTAFYSYHRQDLKRELAGLLYGSIIIGSASRLERYAACAYAHFLQYGLSLKEREEYQLAQMDLGNVFHGVLELFSKELQNTRYTWFDFPDGEGEQMLWAALEQYSVSYGETIFYSNARNEYLLKRLHRILLRSVKTIKKQLQQGMFAPKQFEVSFEQADRLSAVNIALSETEKLKLTGRIDRVDTYEDEDHVYVKVIDYKSGSQKFDLAALYHGLQLQLVIYMDAALEIEKRSSPDKEAVPAALLYYHIADPMIKTETELSPEELNTKILQELCMNGVVNEKEGIVPLLDREFTDQSFVIPVTRKKDGGYGARSSLLGEEEFQLLSHYVNRKIKQFGTEILAGRIDISPYEQAGKTACTYCDYQAVCGFDMGIPGYEKRILEPMEKEEILAGMRDLVAEGKE